MNPKGSEEDDPSSMDGFNKALDGFNKAVFLGGSLVMGVVIAIAAANSQRNASRVDEPKEKYMTGEEELNHQLDNIREEMISKGLWDK